MFNLSFTDIIAGCIPVGSSLFAWVKYLDADKEKHRVTQQEETLRHQANITAEAERDKRKIEAEVEKDRIKAEVEITKAKESSVGGEAVAKVWKEFTALDVTFKKMADMQNDDHFDVAIVKEIVKEMRGSLNGMQKAIFEKVLNN